MEATQTMNYLIASAFVMMAAVPYIAVFYAVDYPAYFAIAGIVQSLVLIGSNSFLIPILGIEGAGITRLITRIIITGYTMGAAYYFSHRQFNIQSQKLRK
jgi:O-antigen/teichoic acid export membrane protein